MPPMRAPSRALRAWARVASAWRIAAGSPVYRATRSARSASSTPWFAAASPRLVWCAASAASARFAASVKPILSALPAACSPTAAKPSALTPAAA